MQKKIAHFRTLGGWNLCKAPPPPTGRPGTTRDSHLLLLPTAPPPARGGGPCSGEAALVGLLHPTAHEHVHQVVQGVDRRRPTTQCGPEVCRGGLREEGRSGGVSWERGAPVETSQSKGTCPIPPHPPKQCRNHLPWAISQKQPSLHIHQITYSPNPRKSSWYQYSEAHHNRAR